MRNGRGGDPRKRERVTTLNVGWAARELLRTVPLLAPKAPDVLYTGWLADGNIGDYAALAGHRIALPALRIAPFTTGRLVPSVARTRSGHRARAVLIGGGNQLGWPLFRAAATRLRRGVSPVAPMLTLGAGVEDPAFAPFYPALRNALGASGADAATRLRAEHGRWADLFDDRFPVAVRGERSRELLDEARIPAVVTGEPALLLARRLPAAEVEERLLGVNVAAPEGLWGSDPERVIQALALACRALRGRGWRIRLVPTWPGDLPAFRELARRLGGVTETVRFRRLDRLMGSLRECHAFVGVRLHSVALAAAAGVPALALEYHPKCAELHALIGREAHVIRTDAVTAAGIEEQVEAFADRESHARAVADGVAAAVMRLERRAGEIALAVQSV
jgi:hypothetical protein